MKREATTIAPVRIISSVHFNLPYDSFLSFPLLSVVISVGLGTLIADWPIGLRPHRDKFHQPSKEGSLP
jgi:hypothetical protein